MYVIENKNKLPRLSNFVFIDQKLHFVKEIISIVLYFKNVSASAHFILRLQIYITEFYLSYFQVFNLLLHNL